jgi:hypothetical protein
MNSKFSMVKSVVVGAALAAGVSAIARADDSSMSRFGGDSYAHFNGAAANNAPSTWRQSNPNGVSESTVQALSGFGQAWKPAPVLNMAPSTWQPSHPSGMSERELQALSSEAPAWHQPDQPATSALASTNGATNMPSASREPLGARIARFFHVTPRDQATLPKS